MTASLVLICGGGSGAAWGASPTFARTSRAAISLVLIRGRADSGCSTGSTLAGDSWTAASRVLIRGGSAPSRGAGAVSPWLPRTVDSRILIRCRSDPAAGVDSGLTPSEGAAPPSLAVTTSLVLIRGGSWEGGSEGGSWGADGSVVVRGSSCGAWPLLFFFFFSRASIPRSAPRSARRAPPAAVSSIRSPP